MDVDDVKVFKILDLEDIEKTFSAYQRQQVNTTSLQWSSSPVSVDFSGSGNRWRDLTLLLLALHCFILLTQSYGNHLYMAFHI